MPLWFYNLQKRSSSARIVLVLHQFFITSYRLLKVTSHLTGFLMVFLSIFCILYNQSELNIELLRLYWCSSWIHHTANDACGSVVSCLSKPCYMYDRVFNTDFIITWRRKNNIVSRFLTMATIPIMLMVPILHPCACKSMVIVNASVIGEPLALIYLDVYISKLRIFFMVTLDHDSQRRLGSSFEMLTWKCRWFCLLTP